MLSRLATVLHRHGRKVLFVAIVGTVIAGAFGFSVAKHLSPYGADDPATQSVQARDRYQRLAGRQIDAGIVALVRSGNVRSTRAENRINQVKRRLAAHSDLARVISFYDAHDPAMVSRDGRSTYVLAYLKPLSDKRLKDEASRIESQFAGQPDVRLGGQAVAN